ncbi:hypothetical protein [Sinorhizobium medicae]
MRAGKLDNTIEVKRETLIDDGYGNQVPGGPPRDDRHLARATN